MMGERSREEIISELEYARDRYRNYSRAGQKQDAKIIKKDIEELEAELEEMGFVE